MSGIAQKWAWTQQLPITEKLVLVVLAYHADDYGLAWAKSKRMRDEAGLSRSGFKVQIRKLEKRGLVERKSHYSDTGRQTTNRYQLDLLGGHHMKPLPGHDSEPLPGHELMTPSGSLAGDPHDIQYYIHSDIQSIGDKSQETPVKLEDVLTEGEKLSREDIFCNALRKSDKLTPDGCAYLWRQCRASAGENGFQAELLIKEKKMLHRAYERVGENYNLAIWAVMSDWIGFTKFAAHHHGAFNMPTTPTINFFTKFIEAAVSFNSTNTESAYSGFVQVTANTPKALTKPNENKDNGGTAITSDELAAISEGME